MKRPFHGIPFLVAAVLMAAVPSIHAQEGSVLKKQAIGRDRLLEVQRLVTEWAKETADLRNAFQGMDARQIVQRADGIRSRFDEVIVLMATTDPVPEWKRAAVVLLMGVKGVELALWHYIHAAAAAYDAGVAYGDLLLKTAVQELTAAGKLLAP